MIKNNSFFQVRNRENYFALFFGQWQQKLTSRRPLIRVCGLFGGRFKLRINEPAVFFGETLGIILKYHASRKHGPIPKALADFPLRLEPDALPKLELGLLGKDVEGSARSALSIKNEISLLEPGESRENPIGHAIRWRGIADIKMENRFDYLCFT